MNDAKRPVNASRGSGLSAPLRRFLRPSVDERAVQKMWRVIAARGAPAIGTRHGKRRLAPWAALATAGLAALGLGVLGLGVLERQAPEPLPGRLLTSEGRPFESLEPAAGEPTQAVTWVDGSRVEVSPGARVEALAATPSEVVLLVRRGRVRFLVTPGGPRRWLIETASARIEVVGTVLSVDAVERAVHVHVEEGAVLVRSPWLPDGVARLGAGQSLRVSQTEPSPVEQEDATPAEPSLGVIPSPPQPPLPAPVRVSRSSTAPLEKQKTDDATERLWAEVDRARRAGESRRAAELLEGLLREHRHDPQTAVGALTLGMLYADELGQPALAVKAFRQALALGLPAALRDGCYLRWAEAGRAAGDVKGVRRAVEEYTREYPNGPWLPRLQGLLDTLRVDAAASK